MAVVVAVQVVVVSAIGLWLMFSLTNRTEPSHIRNWAPPTCSLDTTWRTQPPSPVPGLVVEVVGFGVLIGQATRNLNPASELLCRPQTMAPVCRFPWGFVFNARSPNIRVLLVPSVMSRTLTLVFTFPMSSLMT